MPHLIIEAGAGVPAAALDRILLDAHRALLTSGQVASPIDLKSRVVRAAAERVGGIRSAATFVHAELRLLPGRSPEVRRALADQLLQVLDRHAADDVELSVEVRLMDDVYVKRTPAADPD